jgi:hypothetical protein
MIMGKIAFAENGCIRGIIPGWVMQPVRCIEMLLTAYGHWMAHVDSSGPTRATIQSIAPVG